MTFTPSMVTETNTSRLTTVQRLEEAFQQLLDGSEKEFSSDVSLGEQSEYWLDLARCSEVIQSSYREYIRGGRVQTLEWQEDMMRLIKTASDNVEAGLQKTFT